MSQRPDADRPRTVVRASGEMLRGAHPGDRRLRLSRQPVTVRVEVPTPRRRKSWHPAVVFLYGFALVILVGAALLTLPIASAAGHWTPFLDALFTATSAVCVTGLVVLDTGTYWSAFGHVVILLLFQIGGLGFMVSSTGIFLLMGRRITLRDRVLLKESLGTGGLGTVYLLARRILVFTLVIEAIGALVLTLRFLTDVEPPLALWWGVFHAVSAFNNAGIDLFGEFRSLTPFSDDPSILIPIATLFILGSLSYPVLADISRRTSFTAWALDTKLVVTTTVAIVAAGTAMLLAIESRNPATLGGMDPGLRLLNAFFLAASRTAGFSPLDLSQMTEAGLIVLIALMFIGGAAGSTAGGIKVQTFSILFFAIVSAVRGLPETQAFRRTVPTPQVFRAMAVALLSLAWVFSVALALELAEAPRDFGHVLFEAFSAFGTVGYSAGITPEFTTPGKLILILAMFVGRLGPLTLVLALAARERGERYRWAEETARIG